MHSILRLSSLFILKKESGKEKAGMRASARTPEHLELDATHSLSQLSVTRFERSALGRLPFGHRVQPQRLCFFAATVQKSGAQCLCVWQKLSCWSGHAVFLSFFLSYIFSAWNNRERAVGASDLCGDVLITFKLSQRGFGETDLSQHFKNAWPNFPSAVMQIGSVLFCIVTLKSHTAVVGGQTQHQT